jgi:hypothetical protein
MSRGRGLQPPRHARGGVRVDDGKVARLLRDRPGRIVTRGRSARSAIKAHGARDHCVAGAMGQPRRDARGIIWAGTCEGVARSSSADR